MFGERYRKEWVTILMLRGSDVNSITRAAAIFLIRFLSFGSAWLRSLQLLASSSCTLVDLFRHLQPRCTVVRVLFYDITLPPGLYVFRFAVSPRYNLPLLGHPSALFGVARVRCPPSCTPGPGTIYRLTAIDDQQSINAAFSRLSPMTTIPAHIFETCSNSRRPLPTPRDASSPASQEASIEGLG